MSSEAVCCSSCMALCRAVGVGEEGGRREPTSGQSSGALGGWTREDCRKISTWPWVGTWLCEAAHPIQWRVDKGQSLVPGAPGLHNMGPKNTRIGQRERGSDRGDSP